MSVKDIWLVWDRFWFSNGSPTPVALFRILVGLLLLQLCWGMSADLLTFFGKNAVVSQLTSSTWFGMPKLNIFAILPDDDHWVIIMYWLLIVAGVFLTVGIFSRVSAFTAYLLLISFQSRNNIALYNILELLFLMCLWLMFSRCGDALSFDRLMRIWHKEEPEMGPAKAGSIVGQRLVQLQVILIYWGAFSSKLQGSTWMDGTAVYYATHSSMFHQLQFGDMPLLDDLWVCKIASWATLLLEFMLMTLVWIREFRYPILLIGAFFHIGMEMTLSIPLLQPIMVAAYVTFIDPNDLRKVMELVKVQIRKFIGPPLCVAYNGVSGLSCRLAETVRRLDILGLVELKECHEVSQKRESGGDLMSVENVSSHFSEKKEHQELLLMRSLFWRLPLLIPFVPLLFLPGVGQVVQKLEDFFRRLYPAGGSAS